MDEERSRDLDLRLVEIRESVQAQIRPELTEQLSSLLTISLHSLDTDLQQSVNNCVQSVLSNAMDTEGDVAKLGEAWVHQGYLHMQLLAPKGPVDPIERQAVKLKILKQEVTILLL